MKYITWNNLKTRILIISVFLAIWCFNTDSPFQKGGVNQNMHYIILLLFLLISLIYLSTVRSFILAGKVLYSALLAFFSLFGGYLLTAEILEIKYGFDYQLFLTNSFANFIFYFLTNGFLILCTFLILRFKKQ